jgi:competence protein ComEC
MAIGKLNGKIINYTNILLISLLWFLILNPLTIVYDIGFHLSFLSIIALVYITPIFNQYLKSNNPIIRNCLVVFNATLAVTVLLLPYLVYIFKDFNLMSLIFNILLIPFSGVILGAVFLVVLLGMVTIPLARVFGLVINYLSSVFV